MIDGHITFNNNWAWISTLDDFAIWLDLALYLGLYKGFPNKNELHNYNVWIPIYRVHLVGDTEICLWNTKQSSIKKFDRKSSYNGTPMSTVAEIEKK